MQALQRMLDEEPAAVPPMVPGSLVQYMCIDMSVCTWYRHACRCTRICMYVLTHCAGAPTFASHSGAYVAGNVATSLAAAGQGALDALQVTPPPARPPPSLGHVESPLPPSMPETASAPSPVEIPSLHHSETSRMLAQSSKQCLLGSTDTLRYVETQEGALGPGQAASANETEHARAPPPAEQVTPVRPSIASPPPLEHGPPSLAPSERSNLKDIKAPHEEDKAWSNNDWEEHDDKRVKTSDAKPEGYWRP